MRTFKLILEYDGADFHGWQAQPGLRTVQEELARAIESVTLERSMPVGAGRTDAGVHAVGQVASFRSSTALSPAVIRRALNARLPADIRVRLAEEAPPSFDARLSARSRSYRYILIRRPTALWRRNYYLVTGPLDLGAMRGALADLRGEHDFTTFTTAEDGSRAKGCRVIDADLFDEAPLITIAVTADHFLHRMVRAVAGTVLEIGRGKPWRMAELIAARDPGRSGPHLPPHGLYLMSVEY